MNGDMFVKPIMKLSDWWSVKYKYLLLCSSVGCIAQLAERRSLAGELTLSCARPAADG